MISLICCCSSHAFGDQPHPLAPDAGHLLQSVGVPVDDFQRVQPEEIHDALGHLRPDPLDQPAAQILADPLDGGGKLHGVRFHVELLPVLRVRDPEAGKAQRLADVDTQHGADDRHLVALPLGNKARDGVAIFLVVVGQPLEGALKLVQRFFFHASLLSARSPCPDYSAFGALSL